MNLAELPVDIILYILQFLPIHSLHELCLTSKHWNELIQANESFLYHSAAVLHGYTPSTTRLVTDLPNLFSMHALSGVNSWQSFCKYSDFPHVLNSRLLKRQKTNQNCKELERCSPILHLGALFDWIFRSSYQSGRKTRFPNCHFLPWWTDS